MKSDVEEARESGLRAFSSGELDEAKRQFALAAGLYRSAGVEGRAMEMEGYRLWAGGRSAWTAGRMVDARELYMLAMECFFRAGCDREAAGLKTVLACLPEEDDPRLEPGAENPYGGRGRSLDGFALSGEDPEEEDWNPEEET